MRLILGLDLICLDLPVVVGVDVDLEYDLGIQRRGEVDEYFASGRISQSAAVQAPMNHALCVYALKVLSEKSIVKID